MQFFVCAYCNHVDEVDLCHKHNASIPTHADWMCTKCADKPWHNFFPYREYDPERDLVVNRPSGIGFG